MTVEWKRPESSYHESKCGRFEIHPIYRSTVNPSGYRLKDKKTGKERWVDRVRDAKQAADTIIADEENPPTMLTPEEIERLF